MKTIYHYSIIFVITLLLLPLQKGLGQSLKLTGISPRSAAPGSSIDIQGTGFDAAAGDHTVSFIPAGGGTATNVTPTSLAGNQILSVDVPAVQGGNYTISVTRASDVTADTLATLFSVATGGDLFTNQKVILTTDNPSVVLSEDLDEDGKPDVISGTSSKLFWQQNNGDGSFGVAQQIGSGLSNVSSISAGDLDGDGDLDLIITRSFDVRALWFENQIGEPGADADGFDGGTELTGIISAPRASFIADLDTDGDPDIVTVSSGDDKVAWFENQIGETGADADGFGDVQVISTSALGPFSVFGSDFDGDGDIDLVSASIDDNKVAWYENQIGESGADADGFGSQQIITTGAGGAQSVFAIDLDGDGDDDIIAASNLDNEIVWFENKIGESGADTDGFGVLQVVTSSAAKARSVFAADLDADGDHDILSASSDDDKIAWYENQLGESGADSDGFGGQQIISDIADAAQSVFAADLNGDGDLDVLSASQFDGKIALYENKIAPVTTNSDLFGIQSQILTLSNIDFPFSDVESSDTLTNVEISSLPQNGTLFIDGNSNGGFDTGEEVTTGENISSVNLFSGVVKYLPSTPFNGFRIDSLLFKVSDGVVYSDTAKLYITLDATETSIPGTNGEDGWHLLSTPWDVGIGDLIDNIWTQGITGSDAPNHGTPNVFTYSEQNQSFEPIQAISISKLLSVGQGIAVFVFDDQDFDGNGDGWPKTLDVGFTNRINPPVDVPVSSTDSDASNTLSGLEGWNLIGNPLGTALQADSLLSALQKADPAANQNIYVWDKTLMSGNGDYRILSSGDKIAPYQAMFVRLGTPDLGNQTLTLDNNDRAAGNPVVFKRVSAGNDFIPQLKLLLRHPDSGLERASGIRFADQSKTGLDPFDVYELVPLSGDQLSLVPVIQGQRVRWNFLPGQIDTPMEIPLDLSSTLSGNMELNWEFNSIPDNIEFTLVDRKSGKEIILNKETIYRFEHLADSIKAKRSSNVPRLSSNVNQDQERFLLQIKPGQAVNIDEPGPELPQEVTLKQNFPNPFNPTTTIEFALPERTNVTLQVYNIMGREVVTLVNEVRAAGTHSVTFDASRLASGIYLYRLEAGSKVFTKKLTLIK